jgi:hypothetical protein
MELTWKQAREALTADGRPANDAQDVLDDLAHWGVGSGRAWSYKTPDGVRWLTYAGTDATHCLFYVSSDTRPDNFVSNG